MCIHFYYLDHLWSLSLIGKNLIQKPLFCVGCSASVFFFFFFILGNGNNLSHFSFSTYFFHVFAASCQSGSPVPAQWSTVRVTNTEGKWLQWNRDTLKSTDHLVCSVFVLPFIQTKTLRASARRQTLYPIIFRRVKNPNTPCGDPFRSYFLAPDKEEWWGEALCPFILPDKLRVLCQRDVIASLIMKCHKP